MSNLFNIFSNSEDFDPALNNLANTVNNIFTTPQPTPVPANDITIATGAENEPTDMSNINSANVAIENDTKKDENEKIVDEYTFPKGKDRSGYNVNNEDGVLSFALPDYGYEKYITDIANWQKQRVSFGAEPGYYYFKVFFNFMTNYGLLGGLMTTIDNSKNLDNKNETLLSSKNTAYGYLQTIKDYHKYENVSERILALAKFAATLKDISLRTPWIFKTLSGLNTINSAYVSGFDKEKNIIIGCNQESVDSRIGTLMDLYKFACFDQINCKEIIPANLRKFEMSIMIYHMPLNMYHTKVMTDKVNAMNIASPGTNGQSVDNTTRVGFDGTIEGKTTNSKDNFSNMMSFKLFTFLNCEIDCENINEYYTDGMSNETAFQLGNNQIKIKYDRVYEHRMNEWGQMFFGSDGFYYNHGIPEIFSGKSEFNINDNTQVDMHSQRINALNKKWVGNMPSGMLSIMDYQKLLLGRYYLPDIPVSINDMLTTTNNAKNSYNDWYSSAKDNMFNRIFRN